MNAVTVIPVHNGSKRVLNEHSSAQWETVVEVTSENYRF